MKTLQYINNGTYILCILSGLLGFFYSGYWVIGGLLIIPLATFQVLTGIVLFLTRPRSIRFQLYIGGLVLFMITYHLPIKNAWMILPIPLSLYFTFMIHTIHQQKKLSF